MKTFILVIAILSFCKANSQNNELIEHINTSQILAHQINNNEELGKVIDFYKYYLSHKGVDTLEKGTETIITFTKSILFPNWLPNYGYKLNMLNAKSLPNNKYEIKLCLTISFIDEEEKSKDQYFYIYNAMVVEDDGIFYADYNLRNEEFQELKLGNISYLYNSNNTLNTDTSEVTAYCHYLEEMFDVKFSYPLTYVVTNYYDAYKIFGFDYSLESSGRNIDGGILVSVNKTFIDKHELCHAVLSEIEFPYFLSEGIATYFGGTNNYSLEDYFNKFKKDVWTKLDTKTKQKYVKRFIDNDNSIMLDGNYNTFFYLASAKLVEKVIEEKGINNITKYTKNIPKSVSPRKYIEEYLNLNLNSGYFISLFNL